MVAKSYWRGHPIEWLQAEKEEDSCWVFKDNGQPIIGYGGEVRPCAKCGKLFEGSNIGEADPCLGELPGVDNACCGHGIRENSYVRFTNGVVLKGFTIENNEE